MKCKTCGSDKEESEFYKDKYTKRGHKANCKDCMKRKKNEPQKRKIPVIDYEDEDEDEENDASEFRDIDLNDVAKSNEEDNDIKLKYIKYPDFPWEQKMEKGKHYSISLMAGRNSGKTYLIKDRWKFFKSRYDIIVVFSNSLRAAAYDFISKEDRDFCFDAYIPDVLTDLEKLQNHTSNAFNILIIFDDSVSKKQKYSNNITQLFTRGRNMNMTVIFSTQSPMFIDSDSRGNIDFLVLLKIRTPDMKNKIIDHFLRYIVPTPKGLTKKRDMDRYYHMWLNTQTKDRNCMIIDYLNDDEIYHYRAK